MDAGVTTRLACPDRPRRGIIGPAAGLRPSRRVHLVASPRHGPRPCHRIRVVGAHPRRGGPRRAVRCKPASRPLPWFPGRASPQPTPAEFRYTMRSMTRGASVKCSFTYDAIDRSWCFRARASCRWSCDAAPRS